MKFVSKARLINYILNKVDEASIFAYYLDTDITDIYKCINNGSYRIRNKHRGDENPSLGLQYYRVGGRTKLWARDFAAPHYTGDCFHYAGMVMGMHCNIPEDFIKICNNIIRDLIDNNGANIVTNYKGDIKPSVKTINDNYKSIKIEVRDITGHDIAYWNSYGIKLETVTKERIFPIDKYYIDDVLQDYTYTRNDPAYAYYLGMNKEYLWEIYRPNADKYNKFRTNNKSDIKELYTIKSNKNLILTKSKKDKALITQLLIELLITDTSVLYTSEGNRLKQSSLTLLNSNYKNIFVNFDLDKAGIESMKYFNREYKFSVFPFTSTSMIKHITNHPKDITDFNKRFGYENTKKLFKYLFNKYVNTY